MENVSVEGASEQPMNSSAREAVRAKLQKVNFLVTITSTSPNAVALAPEERMRLGTLPPDSKSLLELVHNERGDH